MKDFIDEKDALIKEYSRWKGQSMSQMGYIAEYMYSISISRPDIYALMVKRNDYMGTNQPREAFLAILYNYTK